MRRVSLGLLLVVSVSLCVAPPAQAGGDRGREAKETKGKKKEQAKAQELVLRYIKAYQARDRNGFNLAMVALSDPAGRGNVALPLGGKMSMPSLSKKVYEPIQALVEKVKELDKGDIVRVRTKEVRFHGTSYNMIVEIEPYRAPAGEADDPSAFIYKGQKTEKAGKREHLILTLSKLGTEYQALVPTVRGEEGHYQPDPEVVARLEAIEEGDMVEIDAARIRGKAIRLNDVHPYRPPLNASFVSLSKAEPPAAEGEEGVKYVDAYKVTLNVGGAESSWPVAAKVRGQRALTDRDVLRPLNRAKRGQPLAIRLRTQNGRDAVCWVRPGHIEGAGDSPRAEKDDAREGKAPAEGDRPGRRDGEGDKPRIHPEEAHEIDPPEADEKDEQHEGDKERRDKDRKADRGEGHAEQKDRDREKDENGENGEKDEEDEEGEKGEHRAEDAQ